MGCYFGKAYQLKMTIINISSDHCQTFFHFDWLPRHSISLNKSDFYNHDFFYKGMRMKRPGNRLPEVRFDITKRSVIAGYWGTHSSALLHLRSGEHVASEWGYSQSHICWKAFLFDGLVFHQIRELNHLNMQLRYLVSAKKNPNLYKWEKKKLVFS